MRDKDGDKEYIKQKYQKIKTTNLMTCNSFSNVTFYKVYEILESLHGLI